MEITVKLTGQTVTLDVVADTIESIIDRIQDKVGTPPQSFSFNNNRALNDLKIRNNLTNDRKPFTVTADYRLCLRTVSGDEAIQNDSITSNSYKIQRNHTNLPSKKDTSATKCQETKLKSKILYPLKIDSKHEFIMNRPKDWNLNQKANFYKNSNWMNYQQNELNRRLKDLHINETFMEFKTKAGLIKENVKKLKRKMEIERNVKCLRGMLRLNSHYESADSQLGDIIISSHIKKSLSDNDMRKKGRRFKKVPCSLH